MGIPTKKVKIGDKEIEIREYLTQEQEDKRINMMTGGKEVAITPGEKVTFMTSLDAANKARDYLVGVLCVDFTLAEFNVMRPELRTELVDILEGNTQAKKVKSLKSSSSSSLKEDNQGDI